MADAEKAQWQLLDDLLKTHGIGHRELARAILGKNAESDKVAGLSRQISKWRKKGFSDKSAARLVLGFRKLKVILPPDYLSRPRGAPTWQEQMEQRWLASQAEVARLRREVNELRKKVVDE